MHVMWNAWCKKDNKEIITNNFGTLLNDNLKSLLSCIFIVEDRAKFGAHAAAHATAQKMILINLFMVGDILFYNMVIGFYSTTW
jgi:hypothetical protein